MHRHLSEAELDRFVNEQEAQSLITHTGIQLYPGQRAFFFPLPRPEGFVRVVAIADNLRHARQQLSLLTGQDETYATADVLSLRQLHGLIRNRVPCVYRHREELEERPYAPAVQVFYILNLQE